MEDGAVSIRGRSIADSTADVERDHVRDLEELSLAFECCWPKPKPSTPYAIPGPGLTCKRARIENGRCRYPKIPMTWPKQETPHAFRIIAQEVRPISTATPKAARHRFVSNIVQRATQSIIMKYALNAAAECTYLCDSDTNKETRSSRQCHVTLRDVHPASCDIRKVLVQALASPKVDVKSSRFWLRIPLTGT